MTENFSELKILPPTEGQKGAKIKRERTFPSVQYAVIYLFSSKSRMYHYTQLESCSVGIYTTVYTVRIFT